MAARREVPKGTLHYLEVATGRDGEQMKCECGAGLCAYELRREGAAPWRVVCCPRAGCSNSVRVTARIHKAEVVT